MLLILVIFLSVVVYKDARILREADPELYREIFKYGEKMWAFCAVSIVFAFLPIYLLRRHHFLLIQHEYGETQEPSTQRLVSDAFGNILKWFWVLIVISVVFYLADLISGNAFDQMTQLVLTSLLSSLYLLYLLQKTLERYPGYSFKRFTALSGPKVSFWKMILIPTAAGLAFAYLSISLVFDRLTQPVTPLSQVIDSTTSSVVMLFFVVMGLLIAPLFEEVIFRGYFYRVAKEAGGQRFAIVLISLAFAVLHVGQYWGDWLAIAMVACVGLALTLLRAWTGSTLASICAHYTYNIGVTVLSIIFLFASNAPFYEYQMNHEFLTFEEKETLLLKSIEMSPDFVVAHNDLAWLYAEENKKLDDALELVDTALLQNPDYEVFLDTKAEVLYKLGRFDEAVSIERKLSQRFPSNEFFRRQLQKFRAGFP